MRNITGAWLEALVYAPERGLVIRRFIWFTARHRLSGGPEHLGIWSGDEVIDATVISGVTGLPVQRTYHGGGNLLSVSPIPRVSDLTIQSVNIDLSQIATTAQIVVREYDLRLAKVEIHDMLLDPSTRAPLGQGEIVFLGEVNGAPVNTPAVGDEGAVSLDVVSDAISMLERTNPRKSSYEGQKRRQGDEWGKYCSTVESWKIPWGEDKK